MPRIKKVDNLEAEGSAAVEPSENSPTNETVQVPASLLAELQNTLKEQGKELQKLKKSAEPKTGKGEMYVGPRAYSYSTWTTEDGVSHIVTDIRTVKLNQSFDLVYKNQYGQYVDNQAVEALFDDGTKATITHYDYGMTHGRSEKLFTTGTKVKKGINGKTATFYVFDVDGTEVAVSENCINQ
jgi:hypothetical protein